MDRSLIVAAFAIVSLLQQPACASGGAILIFTKTNGYRHDSIPAAVAAIRRLADRHGIEVEHSEDAAMFRAETLASFKAIAFINTTGNILDDAQQRALEAFIKGGGGFLGVHSAADTEYDWAWYETLVGAWFKNHPAGLQTGTVRFVRSLGENSPDRWQVTDEFYNFRRPPSDRAMVIADLDESTYQGGEMGASHPIAWCQRIENGRSWYTGLGHTAELYGIPTFAAHLQAGLLYTTSQSDVC